jgi:hypothetical protein
MNIALRKRTIRPVRLLLEDSSKRSFMLLGFFFFCNWGVYSNLIDGHLGVTLRVRGYDRRKEIIDIA